MIELDKFENEDTVRVKAVVHCAGQTRKGPGRLPVVLNEGASGEVPGYIARRWAARRKCEVSSVAVKGGAPKWEAKHAEMCAKADAKAAKTEAARRKKGLAARESAGAPTKKPPAPEVIPAPAP